MGNKKTVRIAEKIEIDESLITSLKEILGDEIVVERCSTTPKLKQIYTKRINILHQAAEFILDTIPLKSDSDPKELKKYINWCQAQCNFPEDEPIETYQKILARYTGLLVNGFLDHCNLGSVESRKATVSPSMSHNAEEGVTEENEKIAIELLNKAEQYVIMQKGGYDFATLMQMDIVNRKDLVLLYDEQLPPCSEETLAELEIINRSPVQITPKWFRQLSPEHQLYFHSLDHADGSIENLKFQLNNLKSNWPAIKAFCKAKNHNPASFQQSLFAIAEDKNLPSWYVSLSLEQQRLIKKIAAELDAFNSTATLEDDLAAIVTDQPCPRWYKILSSDEQKLVKALASFQNSGHTFELRMNELEQTFTLIGLQKVGHFDRDVENLKRLPYWFLTLESYEQRFLKENLRRATAKRDGKVADAVNFIPSRLRTIPGLPNFRRFRSFILDSNGKIIEKHEPRLCSSHPVPRDELNKPSQVLEAHTHRNLETLLQYGLNILFQTLISPEYITQTTMPDYYLHQELKKAFAWVEETKDAFIIGTNHPFNYAKLFDYTTSTNEDCCAILSLSESFSLLDKLPELEGEWDESQIEKLLEEACSDSQQPVIPDDIPIKSILSNFIKTHEEQLKKWPNWRKAIITHLNLINQKETNNALYFAYQQKLIDLAALASDYNDLLNSGYGTATLFDYNGRELFLSTYEHLLAPRIGLISAGSCVSGKDRKWIEICHTVAAILYRMKYGTWPKHSDQGLARENFINIVAELFVWGHGAECANKSAVGCPGTKMPNVYWPADIVAVIKKRLNNPRALEISDILASNNEVSSIIDAPDLIKPGLSRLIMQVIKLSEENQLALLSRLGVILQEKKFLQSKIPYWLSFFKSGPEGIGQIQTHITGQNNEKSKRALVLAEIFSDLSKRPKVNTNRDPSIQLIYNCIWQLIEAAEPEQLMPKILEELDKIKKEAFNYNMGKTTQENESKDIGKATQENESESHYVNDEIKVFS